MPCPTADVPSPRRPRSSPVPEPGMTTKDSFATPFSNIPVRCSTKLPTFPATVPDDPLEADKRGRAVATVHHQVFDMPFAGDIAGERLRDGGPSQLWQVRALAVRLLVPAGDVESAVRNVLHGHLGRSRKPLNLQAARLSIETAAPVSKAELRLRSETRAPKARAGRSTSPRRPAGRQCPGRAWPASASGRQWRRECPTPGRRSRSSCR